MISALPGRLTALAALAIVALTGLTMRAEEHITLTNGFEMNCARRETVSPTGMVRLFPSFSSGASSAGYIEVPASSIRLVEPLESQPTPPAQPLQSPAQPSIQSWLSEAGARHHIDFDLLASLIKAESNGRPDAVSRAGARGLMQLMPATAASLDVKDAFRPDQNIAGGTAYLDTLLTRFHDDIALALAAYNAGPAAVDRWHGIPPYRETRLYVARILNDYNRRKKTALAAAVHQP